MQPDAPRVSVVMAAYNVAPFIAEAVHSALNQTFASLEMIVVDDGSSDGTPDIVSAIADSRLRLIRLPHGSATIALNTGVAEARGEFLALLDGDDRWHPNKLEKHVAFLDAHPTVDLSFSWSRIVDEHGVDTGHRAKSWTGSISLSELLVDNVIANGSAVVLRTSAYHAVGAFDTSLGGCYDLDYWLRVARLRPGNLCAIPEELTDYRRRPGQLTKDTRMMERGWLALIVKMTTLEPERTAGLAGRSKVNLYRFLSYVNYEQGDMPEALRCLRLSIRHQPWRFVSDYRNWGLLAILGSTVLMPRRWHQGLVQRAIRYASRLRAKPLDSGRALPVESPHVDP
ncbi:MAG: glycosyltransferase family 2 protein [Acidobacteriota bacterium]